MGRFCGTTSGIAISGWVFFWADRNGSAVSGMRTVSLFGPEPVGIGGGRTEPVSGRDAVGGFGAGKKLVDELFSATGCGEEGRGELPVSRTGNWIRTVSCGFTLGGAGFVGGGTGNWMRTVSFFGWSGSAISAATIDQKSPGLSLTNLKPGRNVDCCQASRS